MPYRSIKSLPDSAQSLPKGAKEIFLKVVNSSLDSGDSEEVAFKKAWAAVKKSYEKKDGKWVKKMSDDFKFLIPFEDGADNWRLYFPFREVFHMGLHVDFTKENGEEMVKNFNASVPDYPLPVNERHDDSSGIYGFIDELRVTNRGVEWKPKFFDGAADKLREKGYLYASPEVVFNDFQDVDGDIYDNVAMGIAITPRPRLGRATLVFSDDQWIDFEEMSREEKREKAQKRCDKVGITLRENGNLTKPAEWDHLPDSKFADSCNYKYPCPDAEQTRAALRYFGQHKGQYDAKSRKVVEDRLNKFAKEYGIGEEEEHMPDELKLSEEQVVELEGGIVNRIESWFNDTFGSAEELFEEGENETETLKTELSEKEQEMATLSEQLEEKEERLKEFEARALEADNERRKVEFTNVAKEIYGLPEEPGKFADVLMWLEDADSTEEKVYFSRVRSVLETMGNREKMAKLFSEAGSDSQEGQTVTEKFESLVAEKVKGGMERGEATRAVARENKGLYAEYDQENTKTLQEEE